MLTIAIAKGRIQKSLNPVFIKWGLLSEDLNSRKLILSLPDKGFKLVFLKSVDIPTYVAQGSVDLGIVGKDVVLESGAFLYEIKALPLATCTLCLAGPKNKKMSSPLKIGTKYPAITQQLFEKRGEKVKIIPLEGSVEIAPLIGLSDVIVDIVESGETLKANNLVIYETLMTLYPMVVANPIGYKTKNREISQWVQQLCGYMNP